LITDAFCRVSEGKSEAFFLGGFSGSGKSMLVDSLIARVDVSGGSVLMHKFDQMSKDRPMLDILALFNDLCVLIEERYSQLELAVMVKDLVDVFGSDLSVLAHLLPNIRVLFPQLEQSGDKKESESGCNVRSVCFTLQRFIRVVSSERHPIVLFLDDLQWCDVSAFAVVESIICDTIGSNCVFFVGSYRSNEVAEDHEIFQLMQKITSFGVPTTVQSLEGLNPNDLNTLVSDSLCTLPRISKSLSNIIHQKTKGNPFFVFAFLKSLLEERFLEYSIRNRRWVWDVEQVNSMDVTGNVLHLLTSKMSRLSTSIQSALKLAACFGAKIKECVLAALAADPGHSDIRDKLEQIVNEGFMVKSGIAEFKFVHDKVREAAYSLMSESEKYQASKTLKHEAGILYNTY
jgi:predicted ATPase